MTFTQEVFSELYMQFHFNHKTDIVNKKMRYGGGVKMVVWEDTKLASPHN